MSRWRFGLRLAGIVCGLILCVPGHYLFRILGLRSPWPRLFLGWVGWCAGARVQAVGRPLRSNALLLANHVSWLDIMLLAGTTGCTFISKSEVSGWPIAGWLAKLNETVFISRAARGSVQTQARAVRDALARGRPVTLFPEGTTEGGIDVLPFRASLLAAMFPPPPGIKVQPVAIDYHQAAHDIAWVGNEPAGANAMRVLGRKGHIHVTLHFLPPIEPASCTDRKDLAMTARSAIVSALARASDATPPRTRHFPATVDRL